MSTPLDAAEMLDREFLEIRARLLQVAASLDRIDRAEGSLERDHRLVKIREALAVLSGQAVNRAERIQLVFSRPFEPDWKISLRLDTAAQ